MKKLCIIALLLLSVGTAFGDDKEKVARDLYQAMNADNVVDQVMESMKPIIQQMMALDMATATPEQKKEADEVLDKVHKICLKTFPKKEMADLSVEVYKDVFSLEELKEILAFYNSPVGKAFAKKQTQIIQVTTSKSKPLMQSWYMQFQKEAMALIQDHKANQ